MTVALACSACGGVAVELAGWEVLLRPSGALWIGALRLLVAADLHLEKGSAYAAQGQMLPPYDSRDTLGRLAAEAGALSPKAIVLLGDSLHDRRAARRMATSDLEAIARLAGASELIWIAGNHDGETPDALPGSLLSELRIGALRLVHEPLAGAPGAEAAGHLHPCARLKGGAVSVRRRCFVTDGARIVLPAFGAFAGGLNVRDPVFRSLFTRPPTAIALGERRAYPLPWRRLGGD